MKAEEWVVEAAGKNRAIGEADGGNGVGVKTGLKGAVGVVGGGSTRGGHAECGLEKEIGMLNTFALKGAGNCFAAVNVGTTVLEQEQPQKRFRNQR